MILFILPSVRTVSKLSKKIRTATIASTSSVFTHTRIPLFNLYTPGNDKKLVSGLECSEVCINSRFNPV